MEFEYLTTNNNDGNDRTMEGGETLKDHMMRRKNEIFRPSRLNEINQKLKESNYEVEPNFYDALSLWDRRLLITKEAELKQDYGISRLTEYQEENFIYAQPAN